MKGENDEKEDGRGQKAYKYQSEEDTEGKEGSEDRESQIEVKSSGKREAAGRQRSAEVRPSRRQQGGGLFPMSLFAPFDWLRQFMSAEVPWDFSLGAPRADVVDSDDALEIELELPGLRKDDISIRAEEDDDGLIHITVTGTRATKHQRKEGAFEHRERSTGSFLRTFIAPSVCPLAVIDHF